MPSKKVLEQKQDEVKLLTEKFKNSKVILFTDYRGINVSDVTDLRTKLRHSVADYKVIKNNIIRRALEENGVTELNDILVGPTAVVASTENYSEPTKIIYKFAKDNEFYKIKAGIIDGKVMTAEEVIALAKLPSRETLMGMLAGALLGNITKLAVGLNQVKLQKENA